MNNENKEEILFPLKPDCISLEYGAPGDNLLLKTETIMKEAMLALQSTRITSSLQYGPCLGSISYRKSLAKFLSAEYKDAVSEDHLAVTSGASQSFSNIITWFTTPDTTIFLEDPTYFLALEVLKDHGFEKGSFVSVPCDQEDFKYFEKELEIRIEQKTKMKDLSRYPFLFYLVPSFSNPTGLSITHNGRNKLLSLAKKFNVLIVCDDVYQLLNFSSVIPERRLVSYDLSSERGHIISNCSFSKLLGPGLRLGWIETHPSILKVMAKSGLLYSSGSPAHFMSRLIEKILELDLVTPHLRVVREIYERRCLLFCKTFRSSLIPKASELVEFTQPHGGYFVWIRVAKGLVSVESILKKARECGVSFTPGYLFSVSEYRDFLRVSFGMYEEEELKNAAEILAGCLNEFVEDHTVFDAPLMSNDI